MPDNAEFEETEYTAENIRALSDEEKSLFAFVIPSYKPTEGMTKLISNLKSSGFENIVVVNDGSEERFLPLFEEAERAGCRTVRHSVNMGKGRALKDGFNKVLLEMPECRFIFTLDSDGYQQVESMNVLARAALDNPDNIILGCRNYKSKTAKKKKAFSNFLTRLVMAMLCGIKISDTKTTFRVYPIEAVKKFITTGGERYDYETNILLETKAKEIKMTEVVLPDENFLNTASHFNPLVDSFNLYKVFVRYVLVALLCYSVDLGIFRLLMEYLQVVSPFYYTIIDTIIARIISSFVGFLINRKKVFKNDGKQSKWVGVKYYTVIFGQMIVSALSIWAIKRAIPGIDVVLIKLIVDFILFCIGFAFQREWVFKKKKPSDSGKTV